VAVADAGEMVHVLSGAALYAFTGGSPPGPDELRARYARQATGRSPDGQEEWRNWILRREPGGEVIQAHIRPGHAASAAVARRAGLRPAGTFEAGEQLWVRHRR